MIHFIRNIVWIAFTGMWAALFFCMLGAVWCVTVVGIPFGSQAFKFAKLAFLPHDKRVCPHFTAHPAANILWMLFGGILIAFFIFFSGLLSCLTVVGIPSGLRAFKFAFLAIVPFGATVETKTPRPAQGGSADETSEPVHGTQKSDENPAD